MPATLNREPQQPTKRGTPRRPVPRPGESQLAFVERCYQCLPGNTDSKVRYALETWEDAGRERDLDRIARSKFPPNKFTRIRNRPVFVEHSKPRTITDPDTGQTREVTETYDRDALQAIVDRCNERIADTSDFAPITAGHTPDSEAVDKGAEMPDVLGYSGPYRMGIVGNTTPRYAIFCDEFHHIEDADRLSKLQRRSPEVWMEEDMGDRFFDPIAALGAETPRLDMGLTQFARTADGRTVEKYSSLAVSPSGASTFLPTDGGRRRDKNQAGEKSMLTPEDIKQIVDAVEQLDWVQGVKEMLASEGSGMSGDMPDDYDAAPERHKEEMMGEVPVDDNMAGSPAAMWAQVGENDDGMRKSGKVYAKGRMKGKWHQSYMCDDDDNEMMGKYMRGEMEDDEAADYMRGKRSRYMAGKYMRDDDNDDDKSMAGKYMAADGSAQNADPGMPTENATVDDESVTYSRGVRRGVDYRTRYARVERENRNLATRVQRLENEKRVQYRRARLNEKLAEGFAFDFDDEIDLTSDMSDKQFDRHLDRVVEKYERIPLADRTPVIPTPDIPIKAANNDKYARERADKIIRRVQHERDRGNQITWEEAAETIDAA